MNRLEKLERSQGGMRITCIERVIFNPDRSSVDPVAYRDALGNFWTRQAGEPFDAFRERMKAEAISAAWPRIAQIRGGDDE
jgi:hypothetical protein